MAALSESWAVSAGGGAFQIVGNMRQQHRGWFRAFPASTYAEFLAGSKPGSIKRAP